MNEQRHEVRKPFFRSELDPGFEPAVFLFDEIFSSSEAEQSIPIFLAVERENGLISAKEFFLRFYGPDDQLTSRAVERVVKFMLWSRGGWKIYIHAPDIIVNRLQQDYSVNGSRAFDVIFMSRVYQKPFEIIEVDKIDFPRPKESQNFFGGNVEGCRIGFDLGASDYKIAAVRNGELVYSEEIPWNPSEQQDPEYHYQLIQAGLKKAASHLPRVDAIGGSAAGIYINNQVRVASLFRAVPELVFETRVKTLFERIASEWKVPFEVLNDGEITALAGMLSLNEKSILGLAMGSSLASGFINSEGFIPGWLDELAFAPVDLNPRAVIDEWSGDRGVGASYFSQQAVNRLALASGLIFDEDMRFAERLKQVQNLAEQRDERALDIFKTIGLYLGYTIPWYEIFYDFKHLLVLGRVMSGVGGQIIIDQAEEVLKKEFPDTYRRVKLHLLDEKSRRVGQAFAAASLPRLDKTSKGR